MIPSGSMGIGVPGAHPNGQGIQPPATRQLAVAPVKPTTVRGLPPQEPAKALPAAPVLPAPEKLGIGSEPPSPEQLGIGVVAVRP